MTYTIKYEYIKYEYTYTRTHKIYMYTQHHIFEYLRWQSTVKGILLSFPNTLSHVSSNRISSVSFSPKFYCTKTSERQDCIEIFQNTLYLKYFPIFIRSAYVHSVDTK